MLYVFDVGNTLKKNGKIAKENKDSINKLHSTDNICIATFRHKSLLINDLKSINYDFLVTHNGGAIFHKEELVSVEYIPETLVDEIKLYADKNNLAIGFYSIDDSYCLNTTDLEIVEERRFPIMKNIQPYSNKNIISIALFSDNSIQVPFKDITIDYWENSTKCNIQASGVNKTNAIVKIQQLSNSTWDNTISFGDGPNDTNLIKKSSIGYAMHNSHPNTLKVANHILDNTNGLAVHDQISTLWKKDR